MKTRAAIPWEANKPLEIEEVDLEGPKAGEVLVRSGAPCAAWSPPSTRTRG